MPSSLKTKTFSPKNRGKRVWAEEIGNGHRTIYVRCLGCYGIYELKDVEGSVSSGLRINRTGYITPCIVCPHCSTHTSITLKGYRKNGISDVFDSGS